MDQNPNELPKGEVTLTEEQLEQAMNVQYKIMVLESNSAIKGREYKDLPSITGDFNGRIEHLLEYYKRVGSTPPGIKDNFFSTF